jgi:hypothetical protein
MGTPLVMFDQLAAVLSIWASWTGAVGHCPVHGVALATPKPGIRWRAATEAGGWEAGIRGGDRERIP